MIDPPKSSAKKKKKATTPKVKKPNLGALRIAERQAWEGVLAARRSLRSAATLYAKSIAHGVEAEEQAQAELEAAESAWEEATRKFEEAKASA